MRGRTEGGAWVWEGPCAGASPRRLSPHPPPLERRSRHLRPSTPSPSQVRKTALDYAKMCAASEKMRAKGGEGEPYAEVVQLLKNDIDRIAAQVGPHLPTAPAPYPPCMCAEGQTVAPAGEAGCGAGGTAAGGTSGGGAGGGIARDGGCIE